jgi:hypothetical protein
VATSNIIHAKNNNNNSRKTVEASFPAACWLPCHGAMMQIFCCCFNRVVPIFEVLCRSLRVVLRVEQGRYFFIDLVVIIIVVVIVKIETESVTHTATEREGDARAKTGLAFASFSSAPLFDSSRSRLLVKAVHHLLSLSAFSLFPTSSHSFWLFLFFTDTTPLVVVKHQAADLSLYN